MDITFTTLEKLQLFNGNKQPADLLKNSPQYHDVCKKLRRWIGLLERGITVDDEGVEITFDNFTNYLVEEEQDWIQHNERMLIYSVLGETLNYS